MRWLLAIILGVLLLLLMPLPASAETSQDVTVTAVGYICDAPGGFTVTYISDYEVGISWTKGVGAENTIVRACIGRFPESRTDGYEVYYGDGTSATDWVNMETLSEPIYYKAWSQSASGIWEEIGGDTGFARGIGMILIGLIVFGLGFIGLALHFRRMELFFASAGGWAVLGFYSFSNSESSNPTEITDIHMALFWISIALIITCSMLAMAFKPKKEVEEDDGLDEGDRELKDEMETIRKTRERLSFLTGKPERKPSSKSQSMSHYDKTGEH